LSSSGSNISPITGPRYPEGSKKFRFTDYVIIAQDGGKVVSLTHRPLFTPEIRLVFISVRGCQEAAIHVYTKRNIKLWHLVYNDAPCR